MDVEPAEKRTKHFHENESLFKPLFTYEDEEGTDEVEKLLKMPMKKNTNCFSLLDFWKCQKGDFPILSRIMKVIL